MKYIVQYIMYSAGHARESCSAVPIWHSKVLFLTSILENRMTVLKYINFLRLYRVYNPHLFNLEGRNTVSFAYIANSLNAKYQWEHIGIGDNIFSLMMLMKFADQIAQIGS